LQLQGYLPRGFNIDQQDIIVNTESKKIIHTLEDEQRAEPQSDAKSVGHSWSRREITATPVSSTVEQEESQMDLNHNQFIKEFNGIL